MNVGAIGVVRFHAGDKSPYHSLTFTKANEKRKVAILREYALDTRLTLQYDSIHGFLLCFTFLLVFD